MAHKKKRREQSAPKYTTLDLPIIRKNEKRIIIIINRTGPFVSFNKPLQLTGIA